MKFNIQEVEESQKPYKYKHIKRKEQSMTENYQIEVQKNV